MGLSQTDVSCNKKYENKKSNTCLCVVQLSVLTHEKVTLNQVGDEEANVGDGCINNMRSFLTELGSLLV